MSAPHTATLDATFAALADPTRRAILTLLMRGESSVNDLVAPFRLSQPTITKHIQVLERAGLVERRKNAQFRLCRLQAAHLADAWEWLGGYREHWERSLDRLEAVARQLQHDEEKQRKKEKPHARERRVRRARSRT